MSWIARDGWCWRTVCGSYAARRRNGAAYTGAVLAPLRFLWNATRGFRLRPWRSPYVRWRIETYSGLHAEAMSGRDVMRFTWRERRQLLRFLRWTAEMDGEARKRSRDE